MKESQTTEWKESWLDEYLKWLCGFANAEGGVLVVGRNDKGVPVGVANAKKLLEDLPNKIRDGVLPSRGDRGVGPRHRTHLRRLPLGGLPGSGDRVRGDRAMDQVSVSP